MLVFKKLRWRNFLSTGNRFIEIPLDESKSNLVVGSNGAGKSTMIDALHYVLFNKPFRNIKLPQLVNTINNKNCVVEVEFSVGAHHYMVRRGRKPNVFEIYRDGEQLEQESSAKEQQQKLENIIQVDHKSFSQIVVLGSSAYTPFMELTTGARREVIEDLLDIQIFSSMNTLIKQRVKELQEKQRDAEHEKDMATEKVKSLKKQVELLKEQVGEQIEEAEKEKREYEQKKATFEKELPGYEKQEEELRAKIEKSSNIKDEIDELNIQKRDAERSLNKAKDEIEFYSNNDECPTCEQEIGFGVKSNRLEDAEKLKADQEATIKDIDSKLEGLWSKMSDRSELQDELQEVVDAVNWRKRSITGFDTQIDQLESKIAKLKEKQAKGVDSQLKQDTIEAGNRLKEAKANLEEIEGDLKVAESAKKLLKDDGVKSRIIEQYVPVINKLVNQYLEKLNFFVSFELDSQFNETIKSRYRDAFSYHSFSEGQKFRINMALMLTWREVARLKNSVNTNLLIMDEVLDSSLDEAGTEEVLRLLSTMGNKTNLFLISPKGKMLYDQFEQVYEFGMNKNFSVLN